ncbi:MAG: Wzz/FepE/Etk N-terminal domain-containing protein [Rikenellaceae bacterium]
MTQNQLDLRKLAKILWLRRCKILKWSALGALFGIVVAISIPTKYTSNATLAPEDRSQSLSGSMNMVASLMGVNDSGELSGINSTIYTDVVRSTPFLMELAYLEVQNSIPLYSYLLDNQKQAWWSYILQLPSTVIGIFSSDDVRPFEDSPKLQQKFVESLNDAIEISQDDKTRIYSISTTFQDPLVAKEVLDTMLTMLQKYMNSYYTAKERATLQSNIQLLSDAKAEYYIADEQYAKALDRNQNLISKSAKVQIERLKNERDLAFQIYSQLALEVESNKLKVQDKRLVTTVIEPPLLPVRASAPAVLFTVLGMAFLAGFFKIIQITNK